MSGASEAHRGIRGVIAALGRVFEGPASQQARLAHAMDCATVEAIRRPAVSSGRIFEQREDAEMAAMAEAPAPRHGSADARIYAFAKLMFDEVGPDEASRLADRYVAFTQQLIRPWPHED
jgi:hypothetical protein